MVGVDTFVVSSFGVEVAVAVATKGSSLSGNRKQAEHRHQEADNSLSSLHRRCRRLANKKEKQKRWRGACWSGTGCHICRNSKSLLVGRKVALQLRFFDDFHCPTPNRSSKSNALNRPLLPIESKPWPSTDDGAKGLPVLHRTCSLGNSA